MRHLLRWGAGLAVAVLSGCSGSGTEVSAYEGMTDEEIARTQAMEQQAIEQRNAMLEQTRQNMQRLAEHANRSNARGS